MAAADVVVATATTALEAMAARRGWSGSGSSKTWWRWCVECRRPGRSRVAVGSIASAEYNFDKIAVQIEGIYRRVLNTAHA